MEFLRDLFSLIGRVCVSVTFLWTCYEMVRHCNATMAYYKSKGVPQLQIVVPTMIGAKIAGSLMILLGWHAHFGALILLVLSIATAVYLHPFWKAHGTEKGVEQARFMRDVAVIGALFLILALGAGHFGLE